jgi:phosphotriesterase-related protein
MSSARCASGRGCPPVPPDQAAGSLDGLIVTTVLGDVPAAVLGVTLPHEHLLADATSQWMPPADPADLADRVQPFTPALRGRVQMDPFAFRDAMRQQDLAAAEAELRAFAAAGGATVVDLGNAGFGRDPAGLAVLARLTGLNVVMGCGEYVAFGHSPYVRHVSAEVIRDVIVAELTEGAGGTGVRAGVIGEIGTGNPPVPDELKVVRAAAMAHRETGAAVNLHRSIFPDPLAGLVAVDAALDVGVDPGKLIVSHCDERPEPEFALEVARRGAFVELDTFGMEQWAVSARRGDSYPQRALDRDRIRLLHLLLDAGYRDQLLLSHDMAMKPQLTAHGGWGLTHLSVNIEPRLRSEGISAADLAVMRVANPARALARPA